MSINISIGGSFELKPRITVVGVGGAGGNAVNNMISSHLEGVEFVVCNTDAQAIANCLTDRKIQLGVAVTHGLGAGARPEVGRAAAEEALDEVLDQLQGSHMVFITAGMGGGTGTGAAPVIARAVREQGILTVGVVTKPFHFEGAHRMRLAEQGLTELQQYVDTLIVIPNQNLFRLANEKTTFADAFRMADQVLHMGVRGVTDLMMMPGLINLDFADIRTVMSEMGKAMMGTGEAQGDRRAIESAEAAINNPLLDEVSMRGARAVLINITGGYDMTLFEVDAAANRIREEVDPDANIIFGSTFDGGLEGRMRVSVVATGIEAQQVAQKAAASAARETEIAGTVPAFRFGSQLHKPQPAPGNPIGRGLPRMMQESPATLLRTQSQDRQSQGERQPTATDSQNAGANVDQQEQAGFVPEPPAAQRRTGGFRPMIGERQPTFFERMKGYALSKAGVPLEMAEERTRTPAPLYRERVGTAEFDEATDIPAFLKRERVEG